MPHPCSFGCPAARAWHSPGFVPNEETLFGLPQRQTATYSPRLEHVAHTSLFHSLPFTSRVTRCLSLLMPKLTSRQPQAPAYLEGARLLRPACPAISLHLA